MVTIENLRHFNAVVENQGVVRAAEKMFISASSITRSIQQIESELGYSLFDRIGRNLALNIEGKDFYKNALKLTKDFESLVTSNEKSNELIGHYRLGASHFLCDYIFGECLDGFSRKFPQSTLEVQSLDTSMLIRKVHAGDIDVGVAFSPKLPETIACETVYQGQLLIAVGKKHPLASKEFNKVKKLINDYPAVIHRGSDSVERCDNHPMFKKFNIKPKIQMYWDSDSFAVQMIQNNRHWAMFPDIIFKKYDNIVALDLPGKWDAPYNIKIIWNKRKSVSEVKNAILDFLLM